MSKPNHKELFEQRLNKVGDCLIWNGFTIKNGRCKNQGRVQINKKMYEPHRAALMLENIPVPKGREVHHTCFNHLCCNTAHMVFLTRKEHIEAHRQAGTHLGEKNSQASYTLAQVLLVKYYLHWGYSNEEIVELTNVSNRSVLAIRYGNSWGHINLENYVCHLPSKSIQLTLNLSI